MPQGVATAVDVQFSQDKSKVKIEDPNGSGAWSKLVGPLTEPAAKINTEKGSALLGADVSFIYQGATTGSPPTPMPPFTSSIKLEPKPDIKLINNTACLLEGDFAEDAYGNILKVSDVSKKLTVGA